MKKIIILVFILSTFISFSQENEFNKKHNLIWDIGINHTSNFKPEYHPAYKINFTPEAETLYPGHYSLPTFNYQSNFIYRFYFYKGFNINASLNTYYLKSINTRSIDSINKYYVFPDSMIEELPFDFKEIPLYSKSNSFNFAFKLFFGYKYKRLYASFGLQIPLYNIRYLYYELKNDIHTSFIYKRSFKDLNYNGINVSFNARLEFFVLKKKPQFSVYIEASDLIFLGVLLNTSGIKINK